MQEKCLLWQGVQHTILQGSSYGYLCLEPGLEKCWIPGISVLRHFPIARHFLAVLYSKIGSVSSIFLATRHDHLLSCTIIWFRVAFNWSSPSHALFMNLTEKQVRCTVFVFLGLSGLVQCWGATNLVSGKSETLLNMRGITGIKQQRDRDLRKWWDQQIFPFPTVTRCNLVKLARGYVRSLHGPTNRFNSNFCSIVQFIKFDQSICTPSISSSMKCIHPFPICHSCITLFLSYVSHISIKYSIVHIPSFPIDNLWNLVNSHSQQLKHEGLVFGCD